MFAIKNKQPYMNLEEIIVLRLLDQEVFYSHFIICPLPELTVYPKLLRRFLKYHKNSVASGEDT